MGISSSAGTWRVALSSAIVLALIAGCASASPTPGASSAANKPTVVIQSPANGAVLDIGQNVTVTGAASDTVGVDHVSLFADGVSVASSPSGQPAALVPFSLAWLATPAGPHVLQVIAYRADGTPSDPTVVNVVVGAAGSGVPVGSGLFSFPATSTPPLITPGPTKKPKPSRTPTTPPTAPPSTTPTETPTATPMTPLPTMDASGNAPDDADNEPYEIELIPNNTACPPIDIGAPVAASGCIWEQISAPAGDISDDLEFTQAADTTYRMRLTSCSDTSDVTVWSLSGSSTMYGCGDAHNRTSGGGQPGSLPITIGFAASLVDQTYNLYQFTVYQCKFTDCANQ